MLVAASLMASAAFSSADEVLFTSGPQEYGGRCYYWLAEWKLEITLPDDLGEDATLEVLFGSKGSGKRTLFYEHAGQSGSLADVGEEAYQWVPIPLGKLNAGEKVVLYGKGRERVAFLAGVRLAGKSHGGLAVKPIRVAGISISGGHAAVWVDLPGFEMDDSVRRLWQPNPDGPDWERAERSAQYAGIALDKVQRWLHECCLPVRDEASGLFRPTGAVWTYRDTAADCYPFYIWPRTTPIRRC